MPPVIPALIAMGVAAIEGATLATVLEIGAVSLALNVAASALAPHPKSSAGAATAGAVAQPFKQAFGQDAQEARMFGYGRCAEDARTHRWES